MVRYDAKTAAEYREKLIARVEADVRECYQCGNCSAGCPAAFTFDYAPNQIMRMLQIGLVDKVLGSSAIQLCVQCLTCSARCPRNIDIAGIFEDLKTVAVAQRREVPEHVATFNKAFIASISRYGRLPEFYSMARFYTGTLDPRMATADMGLMMPMVTRGKMKFIPRKSEGGGEVGRICKKSMERAQEREKAGAAGMAGASAGAPRAAGSGNEVAS